MGQGGQQNRRLDKQTAGSGKQTAVRSKQNLTAGIAKTAF